MWRALAFTNALAVVSLAVCLFVANVRQREASDGWGQCVDLLQTAHSKLHKAEERLWEIDCSAPLRPNAPFGGMGIWRATHCDFKP